MRQCRAGGGGAEEGQGRRGKADRLAEGHSSTPGTRRPGDAHFATRRRALARPGAGSANGCGERAIAEGIIDAKVVAADKSLSLR